MTIRIKVRTKLTPSARYLNHTKLMADGPIIIIYSKESSIETTSGRKFYSGKVWDMKLPLSLLLSHALVANLMLFMSTWRIIPTTLSFKPPVNFVHRRPACCTALFGANEMRSALASGGPSGSNQDLVQKRLAVARAKKDARSKSIQKTVDRNFHIKRLLYDNNSTSGATAARNDSLYAVKVVVCDTLRKELKLSGREKRGRVFVEKNADAVTSFKALQGALYGFFRALRKNTFLLSAGLPQPEVNDSVAPSTKSLTEEDGKSELSLPPGFWPVQNDDDVVKTFQAADKFFEEQQQQSMKDDGTEENNKTKRPTIVIHVMKDPAAPLPPPPPAYLQGMADPALSPTMTMLSFYSFPPSGIADPEEFAMMLRRVWKKPFQALGRVYVATEGVNAQMAVPTTVLDEFIQCCRSIPELGEYMENGVNIDPIPLSQAEFARAGIPATGSNQPVPPFTNLHIRVRQQVVADGLEKAYDWQQAGYDMPPSEWHAKLKQMQERQNTTSSTGSNTSAEDDPIPLLLDCRNSYESDVGRFEGSEPLDTVNFRDSWDVLKERLNDTPKDAPIMTYCTGGIRCVKVGAYLTQELGFKNVSRLAGGIIAYDRNLQQQQQEKHQINTDATNSEDSMFKGTNFVFDGRLGRPITNDALGTCITCNANTSLVSNCRNPNCHKRIVQCEACRTSFLGTCSDACRQRLVSGAASTRSRSSSLSSNEDQTTAFTSNTGYESLGAYSSGHSSPVPSVYREIEFSTQALIPSGSHMVSGSEQGRLLTQFAAMSREGRILELGTFSGYATACFLEGAEKAGQAIAGSTPGSRASGPFVMTMERDAKAFDVAVAHMNVIAEYGFGETAAEAICSLRSKANLDIPRIPEAVVALQSCDGTAACELHRVSDALATLEEIAAGRGEAQSPIAPFDIVFVDADKTRLLEYAEACLTSDRLLKKGGLMIVDNVLWKGLVLEASSGTFASLREDEDSDNAELRKNRRARKLANKMHNFNSEIAKDDRVEVLVLPIRDGLSIIRKR